MNAGLREASANLMVGNDNERLQTLRRLAVEDATAFDTKQADCSSACETIAAEISEIEISKISSEAEVERLRGVEAEARGRRIDESATFCQTLRELISSEMEREAKFRELVGTTAGLVDGQYESQSSLIAPQRQLERAQREIVRYRDAYGAAAAGVRALEDATALVLERTEPVLAEHQQRAEAWRTQVLRDHVAIWQAASRLLEKQLQHEQGRQAELVEENAQLERQALRALRAGNKGCAALLSFLFWSSHGSTRGRRIKDVQERKKELAAELQETRSRLCALEEKKDEMLCPEIAQTAQALGQPHPATEEKGDDQGALPPPLDAVPSPESPSPEIFVALSGAGSEPHGPLTVLEAADLLQRGRVTPCSLSWCEGMAGWEPLRSSAILAPLLADAIAASEKQRGAVPPPLPLAERTNG